MSSSSNSDESKSDLQDDNTSSFLGESKSSEHNETQSSISQKASSYNNEEDKYQHSDASSSLTKNKNSYSDLSSVKQNEELTIDNLSSGENKENLIKIDQNLKAKAKDDMNPICLLNKENRDLIAKSYHKSYKNSLINAKSQHVQLDEIDDTI